MWIVKNNRFKPHYFGLDGFNVVSFRCEKNQALRIQLRSEAEQIALIGDGANNLFKYKVYRLVKKQKKLTPRKQFILDFENATDKFGETVPSSYDSFDRFGKAFIDKWGPKD